jgi:hypothetical protein
VYFWFISNFSNWYKWGFESVSVNNIFLGVNVIFQAGLKSNRNFPTTLYRIRYKKWTIKIDLKSNFYLSKLDFFKINFIIWEHWVHFCYYIEDYSNWGKRDFMIKIIGFLIKTHVKKGFYLKISISFFKVQMW